MLAPRKWSAGNSISPLSIEFIGDIEENTNSHQFPIATRGYKFRQLIIAVTTGYTIENKSCNHQTEREGEQTTSLLNLSHQIEEALLVGPEKHDVHDIRPSWWVFFSAGWRWAAARAAWPWHSRCIINDRERMGGKVGCMYAIILSGGGHLYSRYLWLHLDKNSLCMVKFFFVRKATLDLISRNWHIRMTDWWSLLKVLFWRLLLSEPPWLRPTPEYAVVNASASLMKCLVRGNAPSSMSLYFTVFTIASFLKIMGPFLFYAL